MDNMTNHHFFPLEANWSGHPGWSAFGSYLFSSLTDSATPPSHLSRYAIRFVPIIQGFPVAMPSRSGLNGGEIQILRSIINGLTCLKHHQGHKTKFFSHFWHSPNPMEIGLNRALNRSECPSGQIFYMW